MGWQKTQAARCSRIITSRPPQPSLYCDGNTRGHGLMASLFGRTKYLTCFYCNTKSDLPHDGLITQWECRTCEAINYLDENGDITDPPVASSSYEPAPVELKYSIHRPESPPPSQTSDSTTFCSTCLKNQHLLRSSLAQYEIELDPYNPKYKQNETHYKRYKLRLEERYPQVCEDCQPKALKRMRQAAYTAKTDHLRRALEKTRKSRKAFGKNGSFLSVDSVDSVAKCLWYFGLLSQLLWHVLALVAAIPDEYRELSVYFVPNALLTVCSTLSGYSKFFPITTLCSVFSDSLGSFSTFRLAKWSLIASVISFYWNPRFREANVGFRSHIQGYSDWYKYQLLLLVIRALCYTVMGTGILADPCSSATVTAHTFILGFITYLAVAANFSLKIDMTPFWESTPENFQFVGPRSSPSPTGDPMIDAFNEIAATPSRGPSNVLRQSPPLYDYLENSPKTSTHQYDAPRNPYGYQREVPKHTSISLYDDQNKIGKNSALLDHRRSFEEKLLSLDLNKSTINLQPRRRPSPPVAQAQNERQLEEMDWSPSYSKYRAFAAPVERSKQAFSSAPIEHRDSPFWYKVPPAPISEAHRLRNPPNQPRLRVASQEVKENFFNSVTRKSPILGQSQDVPRHEVEFAQPRFFPPTPPNEADDVADMFQSFSLNDEISKIAEVKSRNRHVVRALILLVGLIYWRQETYHPSAHMTNVLLGIMTVCLGLSIRSVVDNATSRLVKKKHHLWSSIGLGLNLLECVAAICGLVEVWSRTGDCADCASLGMIYIGEMMVRELWQVLF